MKEINQYADGKNLMQTEVVVALITGAVSLLGALVEMARRQNNRDHAFNSTKLDKLLTKVDQVGDRIDTHMDWHAHYGTPKKDDDA